MWITFLFVDYKSTKFISTFTTSKQIIMTILQIHQIMNQNNFQPEEPKHNLLKIILLGISIICSICTIGFIMMTTDILVAINQGAKTSAIIGANASIPTLLLSLMITIIAIIMTVKYYSYYKEQL